MLNPGRFQVKQFYKAYQNTPRKEVQNTSPEEFRLGLPCDGSSYLPCDGSSYLPCDGSSSEHLTQENSERKMQAVLTQNLTVEHCAFDFEQHITTQN